MFSGVTGMYEHIVMVLLISRTVLYKRLLIKQASAFAGEATIIPDIEITTQSRDVSVWPAEHVVW
jgi:hypothetical protein